MLQRTVERVANLEASLAKAKWDAIDRLQEVNAAKKDLEIATAHRAGAPQPGDAHIGGSAAGGQVEIDNAWSKELADKARAYNALAEQALQQRQELDEALAESAKANKVEGEEADDTFQDVVFEDVGDAAARAEVDALNHPTQGGNDGDSHAASCKRAVKDAEEALAKRSRITSKGGLQPV